MIYYRVLTLATIWQYFIMFEAPGNNEHNNIYHEITHIPMLLKRLTKALQYSFLSSEYAPVTYSDKMASGMNGMGVMRTGVAIVRFKTGYQDLIETRVYFSL